jgi:hypothetical protein
MLAFIGGEADREIEIGLGEIEALVGGDELEAQVVVGAAIIGEPRRQPFAR